MKYQLSMLTGMEKLFYIFIRDNEKVELTDLYLFYGKDDAYARRVLRRLLLKKLIKKSISKTNQRIKIFEIKTYID